MVVEEEPRRLAVVRALAGRLEEEPLQLLEAVLAGDGDLVLWVVLVDEIQEDRVGLPGWEGQRGWERRYREADQTT